MKNPKLNQVLAIEKGVKSRAHGTVTGLYHKLQRAILLNGFSKTYKPINEAGQAYPPERQRVQVRAEDVLKDAQKALSELLNVTAQKDIANCKAKADVTLAGDVILSDVPVTYLLFLEKQLGDIKSLVSKIPVLDEAEDWSFDEAAGLFKSEPVKNHRTQKVQKPIVLYDATEEHPAQTQMISEDVVVGHWTTTKLSGALPRDRKVKLLERVERLLEAVKFAREQANASEAPKQEVADKVFNYLFS